MDHDKILKKDAVRLVRKRMKELLKPYGFQPHPHSKTRLIRVHGVLIDEFGFRTDGYHLEPEFLVYYRPAPFIGLHADSGRLWRTMREQIETHLSWNCIIPEQPPYQYYYKLAHFEKVWDEVVLAVERWVIPYLDSLPEEKMLSFFLQSGKTDEDFFCASNVVYMGTQYYSCMDEAAVYGVGMWKLEKYAEGLPYLEFAQKKYNQWLAGRGQASDIPALAVINDLILMRNTSTEHWKTAVQARIAAISENWEDYLP